MKTRVLAVLLAALVPALAMAQSPPAQEMTNSDVVKLVSAGLSEQVVLAAIAQAPSRKFDLAPAALVELKNKGVPDLVIAAMLNAPAPAVRHASMTVSAAPEPAAAPPAPPRDPIQPPTPRKTGIYLDPGGAPRLARLQSVDFEGFRTDGTMGNMLTGGVVKGTNNAVFRGGKAPVRTGPNPVFYFYGSAPDRSMRLFKLKGKKNERLLVIFESGWVENRVGTREKDEMPFAVEQVGEGIWRVSVTNALQPGEYGWTNNAYTIFDFGVDRK